jgi:hypothetical protein
MRIDCEFPGGNIVVEKIEGDTAWVHQDIRDTEGDWFWFNFRVLEAAGRTITINFVWTKIIGVRGPAVSFDGGATFSWLGAEHVRDNNSFTLQIPARGTDTRIAFGYPYTQAHLDEFLRQTKSVHLKKGELCKSKKGRSVETLQLGCLENPKLRMLLTARHHCCESMPNFTLEGLINYTLTDGEHGQWLRDNVEFLIVPFVDKDGVEAGDQGKNRRPYDHNRDYADDSHVYVEVQALKKFVPQWSQGKMRASIDLHCPWIRGQYHEDIYFVSGRDQENWKRVLDFCATLQRERRGPLPFDPAKNLPFGESWNTYVGPLKSCGRWCSEQPGMLFGSSIEIPYANAGGAVVTPESAREFGCDLARAIAVHLKANG